MATHDDLMAALLLWGALSVTDNSDRRHGVGSAVIRCSYQGRRTVAVGSDATTEQCIGAVLDLLDVHLHEGATYAGRPVAAEEVAVVVGERSSSEGLDAIGSLVAALVAGPSVRVLVASGGAEPPRAVTVGAADFSTSAKADHYLGLMGRLGDEPPTLLQDVVKGVGREELRAYPMLVGHPDWSLRLEGLEVGRFRQGRGWLNVGKVGKTGCEGAARQMWRCAIGDADLTTLVDDRPSVEAAVSALGAFADAWLGELGSGAARVRQNEHALESRILRGACPVAVSTGPLQLLRPDPLVNWGSQFPTRWGHTSRGPARYLDALMRDERTPWAVEMKVRGSAGVGGYYRHAVGQAVLYRHFIRSATPLDPWFTQQGLDRTACRSAVVVPSMDGHPAWRHRLRALCSLVDVELVEVAIAHATLR